MQNNVQENIAVSEEKEKTTQKMKKVKINKNHIQGFIAGILVSAIVFTGLLAGFNPGFLTGATQNQKSITCDIALGSINILQSKDECIVLYADQNSPERRVILPASSDAQITIKSTRSSANCIVVSPIGTVSDTINIVLDGVRIFGNNYAMVINDGARVSLTLKNKNELFSNYPGILAFGSSEVQIFGPGSLKIGKGRYDDPYNVGHIYYDPNNVDIKYYD